VSAVEDQIRALIPDQLRDAAELFFDHQRNVDDALESATLFLGG
jgi:hypothetical protein